MSDTAKALPTNEEMAAELTANGWKRINSWRWRAPWGGEYLGPFQAWKAMKGILLRSGIFGDARPGEREA